MKRNSFLLIFLEMDCSAENNQCISDILLDCRIQIVVSLTFREAVLQLSHEGVAGSHGCTKDL